MLEIACLALAAGSGRTIAAQLLGVSAHQANCIAKSSLFGLHLMLGSMI
jgi:hypothetical protein